MKRILMALAAAGFAAAGSAKADPGGYTPPGGPQAGYPLGSTPAEFSAPNTLMGLGASAPGHAPDRYGLFPGLKKLFHKGGSSCSTCKECGTHGWGKGGHDVGGGYAPPPAYPPMMQGTLAFPYSPYVRSPRDFFMYEPGR